MGFQKSIKIEKKIGSRLTEKKRGRDKYIQPKIIEKIVDVTNSSLLKNKKAKFAIGNDNRKCFKYVCAEMTGCNRLICIRKLFIQIRV